MLYLDLLYSNISLDTLKFLINKLGGLQMQ